MRRVLAILLAILCLSACKASEPVDETALQAEPAAETTLVLDCPHYYPQVYADALEAAEAYQTEGAIACGIIPHHGVASRMIASFYMSLEEDYDAVILLAPNHFGKGGGVVYSDCHWSTPLGNVENDMEFTALLRDDMDIKAASDNQAVRTDHGIGYHLPYLADFLPGTPVTTLMLSGLASQARLDALLELITDYAKEKNVLVIASVDFSHYLMPEPAMEMDELTKSAIAAKDIGRIMTMNSDNMDSPESVTMIIRLAQALELEGLTLLDQSISYQEAGGSPQDIDPAEGTTTYLVYAATKPK